MRKPTSIHWDIGLTLIIIGLSLLLVKENRKQSVVLTFPITVSSPYDPADAGLFSFGGDKLHCFLVQE